MSVLRRHIVLLNHTGTAPHTGTVYGIVPSDADPIPDTYQSFVALFSLARPAETPGLEPLELPVPEVAVPFTPGSPVPLRAAAATPRAVPGVPTAPLPAAPGRPAVPAVPGLPTTPGLPSVPAVPAVPSLPTVPTPVEPATPVPAPAGTVTVAVEGSFDQVHWAAVGSTSLAASASNVERLVELAAVPPYVRARVYDAGGAEVFDWTAYVALGSTAAFKTRTIQ